MLWPVYGQLDLTRDKAGLKPARELKAVLTVEWFNAQKGYGFIQPNNGRQDVFVHISAVEQAGLSDLKEGQKVSYDLESGRQGKTSATNLKAT